MDYTRERIYLAALLHDIGKFYQRADTGSVQSSQFLNEHCKDESTFCPLFKGHYTHKHVLWTAQFIEDNISFFQNLVKDDSSIQSSRDGLMSLAACHHLQKDSLSELGAIIKEADCLSSGMDRSSLEAFNDSEDEDSNWDSFKRKRMVSILETVKQDTETTKWYHLPVQRMELSKNYFPRKEFDSNPDYTSLWESFTEELSLIKATSYRSFSETFLNLLFKYTSCIPSSTINFSDVSLYDHLKTTAAISLCLYDFSKEPDSNKGNPFLLVGGDFSGIQNYIYQIVSKYAGKNLKGRSFYLNLLSDTIVRYILKQLNLFQANLIYNSGGSFYIIAPNTTFVKEQLKKSVNIIEKRLLLHHGTTLFVAIDSVGLSQDDLMHTNGHSLSEKWIELFTKRDSKKNTKFANYLQEDYSSFFEPSLQGGETRRDSITGEEFSQGERIINKEDLLLKDITAKQIEIGKKLRETNLIVIKEGAPLPYWADRTNISPLGIGFTYYFLNSIEDLKEKNSELKASADEVTVLTLNGYRGDCDFTQKLNGNNNIFGLSFYGGNEFSTKGIPSFEDMCDNDHFARLGILRMDVDNLGQIFQKGIKPELATLSRYSSLSRSLDFFFSGYLNTIWRETEPEKSFIIYSGGDDLFIVGSWDVTIRIAETIKKDFNEYTCHNKAFSISGGIDIVPPKFPIMKGAQDSSEEEEKAKQHICNSEGKNSISFLNMPLNWDYEYKVVSCLKGKLVELLEKEMLPKSFLSAILSYYANAEIKNHQITRPKIYWMATYGFSRMKSDKNAQQVKELINNCIKEICVKGSNSLDGVKMETSYHPLELWAFAARWAELQYRSDKGTIN